MKYRRPEHDGGSGASHHPESVRMKCPRLEHDDLYKDERHPGTAHKTCLDQDSDGSYGLSSLSIVSYVTKFMKHCPCYLPSLGTAALEPRATRRGRIEIRLLRYIF